MQNVVNLFRVTQEDLSFSTSSTKDPESANLTLCRYREPGQHAPYTARSRDWLRHDLGQSESIPLTPGNAAAACMGLLGSAPLESVALIRVAQIGDMSPRIGVRIQPIARPWYQPTGLPSLTSFHLPDSIPERPLLSPPPVGQAPLALPGAAESRPGLESHRTGTLQPICNTPRLTQGACASRVQDLDCTQDGKKNHIATPLRVQS